MKDKLIKLVQKEGFILFLFVCVCIVAGGTLFLSMRNLNESKNMENENFTILEDGVGNESSYYDANLQIEDLTDKEIEAANSDDNLEEVIEVVLAQEDYAEGNEEVEDLEFEEEEIEDSDLVGEAIKAILPLDGSVITEYTSNTLVYSETLDAWVGHEGMDIKADEGTPVKAAMDGVVKEVYEDELWGIVIVIDHGKELQTKYSNLSTKEMVKVGLQVKKGDHISKVGKTAKIEMLMEPHIHFEVIKNGKIVDPRSITD